MSAVLILNIFFITFVVVGMLLLLGWGIVTDRTVATRRTRLARRPARAGPARAGPPHPARAHHARRAGLQPPVT
jgi:hypothetical protein